MFVASPSQIRRLFKDDPRVLRVAAEEFLCKGHTCAEVTTGLYLSTEEFAHPGFLRGWVEKALGLESAKPIEPMVPRPAQRP